MKRYHPIALTLLVAAAAAVPARVSACAACYGANIDAPMANGMNWAILTLGVIVLTVLGAFLTFLIYAMRRSEALEAARRQSQSAATAPVPESATASGWPGAPLTEAQT